MRKHQPLSTFTFKRYTELKKKEKAALKKAEPYLRLARRYQNKMAQINRTLEIAKINLKERAKVELENPAKAGRSAQNRRAKILEKLAELEANAQFQKLSPQEKQRYRLMIVEESRTI